MEQAFPSILPTDARKAVLIGWCDAILAESWLTEAERALVVRVRSQLASPIKFVISPDRQKAIEALAARIKPTGALQ